MSNVKINGIDFEGAASMIALPFGKVTACCPSCGTTSAREVYVALCDCHGYVECACGASFDLLDDAGLAGEHMREQRERLMEARAARILRSTGTYTGDSDTMPYQTRWIWP